MSFDPDLLILLRLQGQPWFTICLKDYMPMDRTTPILHYTSDGDFTFCGRAFHPCLQDDCHKTTRGGGRFRAHYYQHLADSWGDSKKRLSFCRGGKQVDPDYGRMCRSCVNICAKKKR